MKLGRVIEKREKYMVMGKKRPQKTKELSVAIAEASTAGTGDDTQQPQTQQQNRPQTPRKRGRPRKITEKTETISKEDIVEPQAGGRAEVSESSSKKGRTSEGEGGGQEQEQQPRHAQQQEGSSACTQFSKDPKGEPSRSRARRKSKPRKSS